MRFAFRYAHVVLADGRVALPVLWSLWAILISLSIRRSAPVSAGNGPRARSAAFLVLVALGSFGAAYAASVREAVSGASQRL